MKHTNKPNQSPETLYTTESHEVVSQDQALVDLNKLLMALSDYQKKLVEQGQDTSEIDAKIYQLQQDKAVLESGNITNKQAITQRINEEMKNFNSLVYSANTEVEKNPSALQNELKAYFDKPEKYNQSVNINGTTYTIAEIIWKGWISDGKNGAATMALRDIMYQETGRSIEAAKQTMNVSENPKDFLKNFQQEAVVAFQKEITDSNGTIQINKFKQAFEFVSELGDLQNVEAEAWKFSWLDKNEKQALLEHMPAVQGIVGSIMTKSIFENGYRFAFNSDNTVIVKPKNANYTQDKQIEQALNDAIARKPGMVPVLKAGLLYQDQDLLKYLQLRADSAGKNISAEAQTPEAFMEYLKNPGRGVSSSDAARAIMDSQHFFDGMNFDAHLKSVSYVPSMASALAVAMNNPDVQRALGQSGQTVVSNPQNTYSSWGAALVGNNFGNADNSWSVPTIFQDWKKNGLIGGTLNQIGHTGAVGLKEIFNSPTSTTVAVLAIIWSLFYFGFKKTMLGILAAPFAAGFVSRVSDDIVGREKVDMPQVREATDGERREAASTAYKTQEEANEAVTKTEPVKNADSYELKKYIGGDANANLTTEQKKYLDVEGNKEVVDTHIDRLRKQLADKYRKDANPPFTEEWLQEMNEFINSQSISQLEFLLTETDEQARLRILNFNGKEWNPFGLGETAEVIWEFIKDNPWISVGMLTVILFALGKIGTIASLPLKIVGNILTRIGWRKLWDAFIATADKIKAKFNRGKGSSDSSNSSNSPDDKPQDADSDTSKTPDNSTDSDTSKTQTDNSTDSDTSKTPDNSTDSDTSKNKTPDNPTDSKTSASSNTSKLDTSTYNAEKIRANMANAVNNSTLTINGSTIKLEGDALAKYNDLQNKIEALRNDPTNPRLQSEMQKSFNNFYYSVDPNGEIITKNVRTQIVEDIKNAKFPQTMEELIQRLSKSAKSVL